MENGDLDLPRLSCKRCGHQWVPRRISSPAMCPRCKNVNWNAEKVTQYRPRSEPIPCKCVRCGYEWQARFGKPKRCPNRQCSTKWWRRKRPERKVKS